MKYLAGFFTGAILVLIVNVAYLDKVEYKEGFEAGKNYVPPVMQRIDRMQNLTAAMKETALDRLAKMSTDSVEKIIKQAGY